MTPALEARDVVHRFRNGRGVGPLTLTAAVGETVVLMGPNGAGKTTLLRILATADRARGGTVVWNGSSGLRDARRRIGFAPDTLLEEGALTARQATHFWCSQWVDAPHVAERVDAALRAFDLAAVADEPVSSFSFGMRRRLALAQALAHEPLIALLDEPTAGLDPGGVEALRAVLRSRAARSLCTIVASNDCAFAASCDRVVFLHDGGVVRDASPAALLEEVGGTRRAELRLADTVDVAALRALDGVGAVEQVDGTLLVELQHDAALGAVVALADGTRGNLRALTLRTPDLADSFRLLTGRPLDGDAS